MKIGRSLRISRRQLTIHKVRTALALLGIVIGVSTVIVMVAVGRGAQKEVLARIEDMGTDLLVVNAGQVQRQAGRQIRGLVTTLVPADVEAILRECPDVRTAAPVLSGKVQVKFEAFSTNTTVVGTTPEFQAVRKFRARAGSFFTDDDDRAFRRVAVLGRSVVINLFGGGNPIGETIRVGAVPFEVIGVMEPKGVDLNGLDQDDQIFIPVRTALRRVFNRSHIDAVNIQAADREAMERAENQVRRLLRDRHGLERGDKPDDFTIQNQADLLQAEKETSRTFTRLTAAIAGVSLLVGGIGILAIMLMAVRERTNEIGLRRAVGASRRDILIQFLIESSLLAVGGGAAGILIGVAAAAAAGGLAGWAMSVSPAAILFSFGFSLAVGLFFGVYPARRASRLDPVVALRSE